MKLNLRIAAIACCAAILSAPAFAVLAKPGIRTLTQPDGSTITATLKGDEHYSFAETPDGYSIVRDKTGWWTYARRIDGLLAPSTFVAERDQCPFQPHLRPDADAVAALPENRGKMINLAGEIRDQWAKQTLYGVGGTKERPTKAASGRQYLNVLLGDFTDSTFAWYSATQRAGNNPYTPFPYDHTSPYNDNTACLNWFNYLAIGDSISPYTPDSSCVGSMSNYFFDFTYRQCWWAGSVAYGSSGRTRSASVSAKYMTDNYINGVIDACDAAVDFDQNGDNLQDGLIIVHPGPGQEETTDALDIWSYSGTGSWGTHDGVSITKVIACPQNGQLGVFCHEMFHQVGGPDLYDYGYSGTPVGEWSLMEQGSNTGPLGGDQPTFPGALLTYDIDGRIQTGVDGWLTQSDSISSGRLGDGKYTIAALDSAGEARRGNVTNGVRLWRIRNNNFRDSAQVWFVELRRRTPPYEIGLPEDGVVIWHIDTRMNVNTRYNNGPGGTTSTTKRAYAAWVESPGFDPNPLYAVYDTNYPRQPANAAYSADDYSIGGYLENRIDSTSIPNSWINQCYPTTPDRTGPWIYDVSREGPTMTFNVLRTGFNAAAPLVSYQTATVIDPAGSGGANNNNGLLDPWENDSIKLTFLNGGAAITAGAQCSLYVLGGSQYVTVTPGWKTVGSGGAIGRNAQGQSDPFVATVAANTPRFTDILFGVKFTSTTPACNDTSNFTLRISPFNIERTYDFSQLYVPHTSATYSYRLQPSDLAVWHDTLYVANANLNFSTIYNRIHKVRRNAGTPVAAADTARSLNNMYSINSADRYLGGIDADSSGNLWYSIADSIYSIKPFSAPIPTLNSRFKAPNVNWAGDASTTMKRVRGIGMGPSVVDTIGTNPMPGDSLWAYWQKYGSNAANSYSDGVFCESLYVVQKGPANGTSTVRYRYGFADSAWGAIDYGAGYNWWNGRAMEYDGMNLWTTSVFANTIIRRDPTTSRITMMMPGPSEFGSYGTYGIAHEATDAAGTPYAPSGTVSYQPYRRGTKHYLYCAAMDEGKIYKILATDFFVPTPCDSVVVRYINTTTDRLVLYKHNADTQRVQGYIICSREDTGPHDPASDSIAYVNSTRVGSAVSPKDSVTITHNKAKAVHYYSAIPVNYGGAAGWGASVTANPLAVELTDFSCALISGSSVTLRWSTASETDLSGWVVERSPDGVSFTEIGRFATSPNPMGQTYSYTDQLPQPGMYYYRLADVSMTGYQHYHDPLVVTFGAPAAYALGQNFPNPAGTSATTIKYALKAPGRTSLRVYNVLGEVVRDLVDRHQVANYYTVRWDGRDNTGKDVSNGVYFYKLISGDFNATKKMTVLK